MPKPIRDALAEAERDEFAVRVHDDFYCFAIPVPSDHNSATSHALNLIVGEDWLVSMGEGDAIDFTEFLEHDVGETAKGKLSGSTFAAALLTQHFVRLHRNIGTIDREVDRVEESVLVTREKGNTLQVMAVLRRQASRLRELIAAYRTVIHALTRPDFLPELTAEDRSHFEHLRSAFERVEDEVLRVRETVINSFDLYSTRVAQDTNRLLRTLTFITIGIGMISALAGIFGMNFQATVLDSGQHGFMVVIGIMAIAMVITTGAAIYSYRRP
ncbi:MAG: CorA family divalent cation transporter [Novosphingobium sp.]